MRKPWEKMTYDAATEGNGGGATSPAPSVLDPAAGAPATTTAAQPAAGDSAGKSWLESLPDDIKSDPSLQMFKEPASLAKSWVNAQKMIGANKVVIPDEKASEEEINAFYQKLGRPEAADKYEFKMPEGKQMDPEFAKGFKEAAYKAGLAPRQVQGLVDWYNQAQDAALKAMQGGQEEQLRTALNEYQQKLGGEEKFNATIDKARSAVRVLADEPMKQFLRDSGMGSRPEVIDMFAKLADMMADDKLNDGTTVPLSSQDPDRINREIKDLEEKMYSNLNSSSMSDWVDQRNKLYERLAALRKTD